MTFKNIFKDLNISRNDYFYLFVLTIFSIILTYTMINFNENIGIYCSDVFIYLTNSLAFAGYPASRVYLYLSPFICFLTSILFRLGLLSEISLYIVTGAFGILGNIGIYVLLKNKFNSLLSLCGAILFGSFSLNLLWWANGTLDVPAVCLSIWTMIFIISAIDKDSKYYLMAFPLLVLTIFTRYTALFLLPLILLYYLSYHDFFTNLDLLFKDRHVLGKKIKSYLKSEEFRNILKSAVVAFVLISLFLALIMAYGSHLSFLTQSSTFASGSKGEVIDNAYTNDTFFYVHEFPSFLFADNVGFEGVVPVLDGSSIMSFALIGLFILGILLFAFRLFNQYYSKENKSPNKNFRIFAWVLFVLLLFVSILSFKINSIITITILLVDFVILFAILKKRGFNREDYTFDILMIAWFLVYFIFFTFLNIKVNRYVITVFPAFIYFAVLAIERIIDFSGKHDFEFRSKNILNIIPIFLIIFCIFSAFAFPATVHYNEDFNKNKVMADYLINHDPDYSSKQIAVYNERSLNWYLKTDTIAMTEDKLDYLDSHNVTYYISDENFDLKNYDIIYNKDGLYLYERIS